MTTQEAIGQAFENGRRQGYEEGKRDAVKHGRCEYCRDGKTFMGAELLLGNDGHWVSIYYCPNCGAKMDGGGDA